MGRLALSGCCARNPAGISTSIWEMFMATAKLALFICATTSADIPQEAFQSAKNCLLDGLAVGLAGSQHPSVNMITEYVRSNGGGTDAAVIGSGFKTSLPMAGLVNGTMCHVLDFDDTSWKLRGHPTAVILPAALAVGEKVGANGTEVLLAYILGFEAVCRIAGAIQPANYNRGYHSTSAIGIFGAATAAAKLLKLSPDQLRCAYGIAASKSGGLRANFGTPTKPLQAGFAAHDGIVSAMLAKLGYGANPDILETEFGLAHVLGEGEPNEAPFGAPESPLAILSSGVVVKQYPTCARTHTAIDAALSIVLTHHITPSQIANILCETDDETFKILIHPLPQTGLEAKFSMPYCLARACLEGGLGLEHFRDETIGDPAVRELMDRVQHRVSDAIVEKGFDFRASSNVIITLTDGRVFRKSVDKAKGNPEIPLSFEELSNKFLTCSEPVLESENVAKVLSVINHFENVTDVRDLMRLVISKANSTSMIAERS
ncbi:MAG: MmgE/PrpD family protein [Planctomycetota bacterium]